jgi:metallophosphoesterase superfamily enzyme
MAGYSWLHLSDIHFGHGTTKYGIDQAIVLERLADDAVSQVSSHAVLAPNCIIVTGDIGNTGAGRDNTEYENAEQWIRALAERLDVRPEAVLFTPGNHDANRGVEISARFPK